MYGRRDLNESELVTVAKQLGAVWIPVGPLDGWILFRGTWLPVEIKQPDREGTEREYTSLQLRFFTFCRTHRGKWLIWRTQDDVIRSFGGRVAA